MFICVDPFVHQACEVDVTALQHKAICSVLAKLWNADGVKEIIKTANVRNQDAYLNTQKILTLWADVDVGEGGFHRVHCVYK